MDDDAGYRGDAAALVWAALGGPAGLTGRVRYGGARGLLPARLPVMDLARTAVAVCALAGAELAAARTGGPVPAVTVDDGAVATAFLSERHLRIDGRAPTAFAPLSGFWQTADGRLRTHANYPHHRDRLLAALGLPGDAGPEALAAELAGRSAGEVEETVYAAGGLAVAVRDAKEWAAHPQGAAVARRPLLTLAPLGAATPPVRPPGLAGDPLLPAAGLRVLDLTRVLAGPVATRTLALLGADVLRIDAPGLPESRDTHGDTGFGKRSAVLDLGARAGRASFEELLALADVVVTGYRPGALDRFGLAPEALAERRPGIVVARLSAWGDYGPWGARRGFDSLVQAATGIAVTEAAADGTPGVLPAQALDHATGYLLAAAVLRALTERSRTGGSRLATLALTQTAALLTEVLPWRAPDAAGAADAFDPEVRLADADSPLGRLRHALPPVSFADGPANWSRPPSNWGSDAPEWW